MKQKLFLDEYQDSIGDILSHSLVVMLSNNVVVCDSFDKFVLTDSSGGSRYPPLFSVAVIEPRDTLNDRGSPSLKWVFGCAFCKTNKHALCWYQVYSIFDFIPEGINEPARVLLCNSCYQKFGCGNWFFYIAGKLFGFEGGGS